MTNFIHGLELSRRFYFEAVKPILDADFPQVQHSAALIGSGSEILGFDTEMSSDHCWGPRCLLFLTEADFDQHRDAVYETLSVKLPQNFLDYPTNFSPPNPDDNNTQVLQAQSSGRINHRVDLWTIRRFILYYLNFDINNHLEASDWLTFPEQKLLTITAGEVFYDEVGLQAVRDRFSYYPQDVWLYLLASAWARIGQEEHLMGRAGLVDDELGSAIIASRLVRDVMRLCFLMEREYAPYPKWFGTAFARLHCAKDLLPALGCVQRAATWQEREKHLTTAYEFIAAMHNTLNITETIPTEVMNFFGRPFRVIALRGYADKISAQIKDEAVKRLADKGLIGNIDLLSDNTDLLEDTSLRMKLRGLYE